MPSALRPALPTFVLYGEAGAAPIDAFHIEALSLRSALHAWEIQPHVHQAIDQIFILSEGEALLSLDGADRRLSAPAVWTIPSGVAHAFRFQSGSEGLVLSLAGLEGLGIAPSARAAIGSSLLGGPVSIPFGPDDPDWRLLGALAAGLPREQELGGPWPIAAGLLATALMVLSRRANAIALAAVGDQQRLMGAFRGSVSEHLADHWTLGAYAAALNTSASTLDRACRAIVGTSAMRFVQQKLAAEIRRRLAYTPSPVSQIAYDLGFADLSCFSRFVRRMTGSTPTALRRRIA